MDLGALPLEKKMLALTAFSNYSLSRTNNADFCSGFVSTLIWLPALLIQYYQVLYEDRDSQLSDANNSQSTTGQESQ